MEITKEMQDLFDAVNEWHKRRDPFDPNLEDGVLLAAAKLQHSFCPPCPIAEEVTLNEHQYYGNDETMETYWSQLKTMAPTGRRLILQPAAEGETTGSYRWEES